MLCWEPASSQEQDSRPVEEWEDIYLICLFSLLKLREWFKSMSGVPRLISTLKLRKRAFFFFFVKYSHLHTHFGVIVPTAAFLSRDESAEERTNHL